MCFFSSRLVVAMVKLRLFAATIVASSSTYLAYNLLDSIQSLSVERPEDFIQRDAANMGSTRPH